MSVHYGILGLRRLVCDRCGVGRVFSEDTSIEEAEAAASKRGWEHDSTEVPSRNWCSDCVQVRREETGHERPRLR